MLEVGSFRSRDCQGVSRREFVLAAMAAPFAWGLPGVLSGTPLTPDPSPPEYRGSGEKSALPRARSILLVWLGGGPSHLDMFDPKPNTVAEYRGPFSTIATRTPGVRFTELLPRLAARSNRFSLIRSNVNFDGNHRPAGSIALTGSAATSDGYQPNFGSILGRHRTAGALPNFISMARGPIGDGDGPVLGYGGGVWGRRYDPFMLSCSETGRVDIPALRLLDGLTPQRLADRRTLLRQLDGLRRQADAPAPDRRDSPLRQPPAPLESPAAREAFDLSREPTRGREAYGHTAFGQSCLLGRRLVQAGVPYVQVNWSQFVEVFYPFSDYGWDTHADNFGLLADWH